MHIIYPIDVDSVEVLFLDFDGTLVDYHETERSALRDLLSSIGIDVSDLIVQSYQSINMELWNQFQKGLITRDQIRLNRFERLSLQFGFELDPVEASQRYLRLFINHSRARESVLETLKKLRKCGYGLYVLTNGFSAVQHERLRRTGILPLVDEVVTSEQVSAPKPSPAIFEMGLRLAGCKAEQSLMVGDSYEADVVGAKNAGIEAALISSTLEFIGPVRPFAVFQNFEAFGEYLDRN